MYDNPRLVEIFQIVKALHDGPCNMYELIEQTKLDEKTLLMYIDVLNRSNVKVEKDNYGRYIMDFPKKNMRPEQLTAEGVALVRTLFKSEEDPDDPANNPKKDKHQLHFDNLITQLTYGMRTKQQVMVMDADTLRTSIIEPFYFGGEHDTVVALDTKDLKCKPFKLYDLCEADETEDPFVHEMLHRKGPSDMFDMEGEPTIWVTLSLDMKAYLQLRDDYPAATPYLTSKDQGFVFHGPVASFAGIGRFVLDVMHLVDIEGPEEFTQYVFNKMNPS